MGKGRKLRITPITSTMAAVLRVWLAERAGQPTEPLFPTQTGKMLSRDALERRPAKYLDIAAKGCPSLKRKKVTLHTLRHTAAMRLLCAGVDTSVIALWLGHEQIETTHVYLHADLSLKSAPWRNRAGQHGARTLPAARQASRFPRGALIMPTPSQRSPPPRPNSNPRSA
jgi:integrase